MTIEKLIEKLKEQQKVRPNVDVVITYRGRDYKVVDFYYYFGDLHIAIGRAK